MFALGEAGDEKNYLYGKALEILSPTEMTFTCDENRTREPFNNWMTKFRPVTEVKLADGTILSYPMSFEED